MSDMKKTLHLINDRGVIRNRKARVVSRIGFTVSYYFFDGEKKEKREAIREVINEYLSICRSNITHFHVGNGRKIRKFGQELVEECLSFEVDRRPTENLYFKAIEYASGEPEAPPLFSIVAFGFGTAAFKPLSGIKIHFPAEFVLEEIEKFVQLFAKWAEALSVYHGTCGLGVLTVQGDELHNPFHFNLISEFPGLDFDAMGSFWSRTAGKGTEYIRSSNWLTFVSNSFVAKLGGSKSFEDTAGEQVTVLKLGGLVALRASVLPCLGGQHGGDLPEGYRIVAKIVKSIRFEEYDYGVINVPSHLDGRLETLKWLRRFD